MAVKLGGSLLSNKGSGANPRFRARVASRLAREVQSARAGRPCLVVYGGGSYGHPAALAWGLGRRALRGADVALAFDAVQTAMDPLRARVMSALRAAGMPVVHVPPSTSGYSTRTGFHWEVDALGAFSARGIVVVTGGDVVLDEELGLRVVSGDELLAHGASGLGVKRVVMATDVDGVRVDHGLVPKLGPANARSLAVTLQGSDATGGMGGKLVQAARLAEQGIAVYIVNGNRPGRVAAALNGSRVTGTVVEGG